MQIALTVLCCIQRNVKKASGNSICNTRFPALFRFIAVFNFADNRVTFLNHLLPEINMEIQSFSQSVRVLAQADNKKEIGPIGRQISEMAHAKNIEKKQLNADTSESGIKINTGNEPQSLVLQTALEGINDALHETFGDNAIQAAYEANIDVSPDTTAERIVSLSKSVFPEFLEQHPELAQGEALTAFTDIFITGVNTGFSEAKDVLTSLNALQGGETEQNIDETLALIQEKLQLFINSFSYPETNLE